MNVPSLFVISKWPIILKLPNALKTTAALEKKKVRDQF